MVKKKVEKDYIFALGRRKTGVARVRLFAKKGDFVVNNFPIDKYFSGKIAELIYTRPFLVTETVGKFSATVKVVGSGKNAQAEATALGFARALDKYNRDLYHSALKKNGLLTRDPRAKERRKAGQMGKARKKKQSPKR